MNLHSIVAPYIAVVNPFLSGTWMQGTGYSTSGDGTQVPTYTTVTGVPMQVQALTGADIKHLDALNIQGINQAVYMNGHVEGVDRTRAQGGDLLIFAGQTWLVSAVLENWGDEDGWTKVAAMKQTG